MITYFNEKRNRIINLNKDSCSLKKWKEGGWKKYLCCWHPEKFLIFLSPEELNNSDEYQVDDPYRVIENIESDFNKRRINCTLDLIKDVKGKSLKLLDIGCGEGHITSEIKKKFPKIDIFGLDYSISAIDYANSEYKEITFMIANVYYPPFPDESFNIVICNNIWEHVPDPLVLLKAISRILKPNGTLIISTPSRYRFRNLLRIAFGKKTVFMSKLHVTEYSVGQIKEQLKYGGFKIKKILSPEIKEKGLIMRLVKKIISIIIKLVRSEHILEATVFYSAIKTDTSK